MKHQIKVAKRSRGPFVEPLRRAECTCHWLGTWTDADSARTEGRRHMALAGMGQVTR